MISQQCWEKETKKCVQSFHFSISRKVEDLELRESAAKVVKATTTSFPLTPPFNGFMEDSGSSIRSYSSTLISTPIARSETMQIQEDEIQRLETENIKQRQEVQTFQIAHTVVENLEKKIFVRFESKASSTVNAWTVVA